MRRVPALLGVLVTALSLAPAASIGTLATPAAAAVGDHASLALGDAFSCSLTGQGSVKCWGGNTYGQLGNGTTTDRSTPVDVTGLNGAVLVSLTAGWAHTCALTDAGGVKCWGHDNYGQLGDGATTDSNHAVDVAGMSSGVVALAAGAFHTCALTDAGAVKCWGLNVFGQLGDGTTTNRFVPVTVSGAASGIEHIAGGEFDTCLVTAAGGAKCWGHNIAGGLGDGTTTDRTTPVDVVGLTANVANVNASGGAPGDRACAVTTGGAVKCWGSNAEGELGDGTTTNRLTPVDVTGLSSGVQTVVAGGTQTCALLSGGAVKCWGLYGVGDGTYPPTVRPTPVDVVGLGSGVAEIDSGGYHSCARTSSGGVTCWGGNPVGQLGIGLTEPQWPRGGRMPHAVSGSFHRDECPTLVPNPHTDYTMTDGYGVGSVATFSGEPGYEVVGTADLTCQSDLTWDGTVPAAQGTGTVVVSPDTGLSGGDVVQVDLAGFAPGATLGWAQCLDLDPPSQDNCFGVIGSGTADGTGSLTTPVRVQRFIYVPAASRWADCADPLEPCVIGAADASDIPGTGAWAPIGFATPPDPPATRGTITLTPPQPAAGQTVSIQGTGFRPTTAIDLFQCTADPTTPADCNTLANTATTDGTGAFTAPLTVAASVTPPGSGTTGCFPATGQCAIATAEAVDFPGTVVARSIEQPPIVIPGAASTAEGDAGTTTLDIPVTLNHASSHTVTVDWQTVYTSAWSSAAAVPGVDYEAASGQVTFAPGQTTTTVPITVYGDTTFEQDELVVVQFHTPTNAVVGGLYGLGLGGITNDDHPPMGTVAVSPDTGLSGGDVVQVDLAGFAPNANLGWAQCIVLGTGSQDNCSSVIGQGQADATGSLTTPMRVQRFIYVPAAARWVDCADSLESCVIGAADISDIPATASWAPIGFATPPDPPVTRGAITLTPPQVTGAGQTVTVHGTGFRPTVAIDLSQCSADPTAPADCNLPTVLTTTDATGAFTAPVTVAASVTPPGGGTTACFPATGQCAIAAAESADFGGTVAAAPIEQPTIVIPGVASIAEGNASTTTLDIPVTLDHASSQTVTVDWQTVYTSAWSSAAAVPGVDYQAASGQVTFAPGETTTTVPITVYGDTTPEQNELVVVQFHTPTNAVIGGFYGLGLGGITNDDAFPTVTAGVGSVLEGNAGTTIVEVPLTLSVAMSEPVTVPWATFYLALPLVAMPGVDYEAASGQVTFAPGETATTVPITVYGDTTPEQDEDVIVLFQKPVNADLQGEVCLSPATQCMGIGQILNDD